MQTHSIYADSAHIKIFVTIFKIKKSEVMRMLPQLRQNQLFHRVF